MKKSDAIDLLKIKGWTEADAKRVLEPLDFKRNNSIDKDIVLGAALEFAGPELLERQRLQAAQRGLATRYKNKINYYLNKINDYLLQIKELQEEVARFSSNTDLTQSSQSESKQQVEQLLAENKELSRKNKELSKANRVLQKDNKDLKNVTDAIKLKLTQEINHLLRSNNISQIKKGLLKLLNSVLG